MALSAPRLTSLTFVVVAVLVIGGFASFLFLSGFAHSVPPEFSGVATTFANCTGPNCSVVIYDVNFIPPVVNVTVRWIDVSGGAVLFTVSSPSGLVSHEVGTLGGCSFVFGGGD